MLRSNRISPTISPMFSLPKKKWFVCLFLGVIALRVLYYWRSDGFNIDRISNNFPRTYELAKPTEQEIATLQQICQKPFHYLGKGSQAYAFESEDGQYVLKLIKCYHLKPIPWLEKLELPGFIGSYVKQHLNRRYQKTRLSFASYKIAHDTLADECGILFLQIIPSQNFQQKATFTDKIGRTFTIDLENYGFVIQRKMDLIFPTLRKYIKENDLPHAKELIHSIVDVIVARSLKGVADQDPDIHKNLGCIGPKAVFIDVGSFHMNERAKLPETYLYDARKITRKLENFLEAEAPELIATLDQALQNTQVGIAHN